MKRIRVSLGERSYDVSVGRGITKSLPLFLRQSNIQGRRAVIVSQKEIADLHLARLQSALNDAAIESTVFLTPAAKSSEASKTQAVLSKLISHLAALDGANRPLSLIALGGGVIGDLTGFAASIYRRGIPYVQVPTTLTAQVDSAIGGKTAVDLPQGKNLLGTIYQPRLVLADTQYLDTLPERFWTDGFAEVIKYGVIKDPGLFNLLERYGKEGVRTHARRLEQVIHRCVKIKAHCVSKDELDKKGIRMILNFGHTAGHAIEAASSYSRSYTHGEAVAIGMLVACDIAESLGILKDPRLTTRLEALLVKFGLPIAYRGLTVENILKSMGYDKKSDAGANRFILPAGLGRVQVVRDVPEEPIKKALNRRKA